MKGEHNAPALSAESVYSGYGRREVIQDVSLAVVPGEVLAVVGTNGAGKSTLLKALFGLLPIWKGTITLDGCHVGQPRPASLLNAGVVYVPQGTNVFVGLSIKENMLIGSPSGESWAAIAERACIAFPLFKYLASRPDVKAGFLSGGEKQMLALARAFHRSPRIMLLDEPTIGLAPELVEDVMQHVLVRCETNRMAAIIVEQRVRSVLSLASRALVLRDGKVVFSGPAKDVLAEMPLLNSADF